MFDSWKWGTEGEGRIMALPVGPISMSSAYNVCAIGVNGICADCATCVNTESCEGMKDASKAPLCQLPEYMISRYKHVRKAAKARFVELKEEELDAAMFKDWPDLVDKVDMATVTLAVSGETWSWPPPVSSLLVSKLLTEVSKTAPGKLPKYMTSRFFRVREAAKARFVESQT